MTDEDFRHWQEILTPPGVAWSGRARYAAAMHFYFLDLMTAEVLEIYRICARLDHEDPLDALRAYHLGEEWIARLNAMKPLIAPSDDPR